MWCETRNTLSWSFPQNRKKINMKINIGLIVIWLNFSLSVPTLFFSSRLLSNCCDGAFEQVYKRSYDICTQLYEKELLTDTSYLHIYGYCFNFSIWDFGHHSSTCLCELVLVLCSFGYFSILQVSGCWSQCSTASSCFCELLFHYLHIFLIIYSYMIPVFICSSCYMEN